MVPLVSSEMGYSLSIARIALALGRERGERRHFSVVLTSLNPAEGVTHLVMDLARYLSVNGKGKIIVVDLAGMGSLAKLLGANEELLLGEFSELNPTVNANLFLLAPEFLPSHTSKEPMRNLLATLSLEDGIVIFDAPRVRENGFLEVAGYFDRVLLVLDPERTTKNEAATAVREMSEKGATVMGVILNRREKQ